MSYRMINNVPVKIWLLPLVITLSCEIYIIFIFLYIVKVALIRAVPELVPEAHQFDNNFLEVSDGY